MPSAVEAQNLNHWTAREFPRTLDPGFLPLLCLSFPSGPEEWGLPHARVAWGPGMSWW